MFCTVGLFRSRGQASVARPEHPSDGTAGLNELESIPGEPVAAEPKRRWGRRLAIVVAVIAVIGLWQAGAFDHALVNVGLNAKECARNGFGATFCGQELTEYRERLNLVKSESEATEHKANEELEAAKRKSDEELATLQRQQEEQQRRSEEALRRSSEEATEGSGEPSG